MQFHLRFSVQNADTGGLAGRFTATGAIAASGSVEEEYALSPPRLRGQQPVETATAASKLHTAKGVLSISYSGIVSSASPAMTVTEGTWSLTAATGAFKGLRGRGRLTAIVDLRRRTMVKRYDGLITGR